MELFVTLVTLLVSLFFTVEIGLLAGICANIIHLALMWSRPKLKIELTKVRNHLFDKYNMVPIYVFYISSLCITVRRGGVRVDNAEQRTVFSSNRLFV